jgi:universal stress protein A
MIDARKDGIYFKPLQPTRRASAIHFASMRDGSGSGVQNMADTALTIGRILAPVDFSDPSPPALRYARVLAEATGAEVLLLYVIEPVAYPAELGVVVNLEADLAERAQAELDKLRDRHFAGYARIRSLVCHGVADQEIIEAAKREAAGMIVIGTHGFSGLKHLLLGSTAERVVRGAPCAVLTVRHSPQ